MGISAEQLRTEVQVRLSLLEEIGGLKQHLSRIASDAWTVDGTALSRAIVDANEAGREQVTRILEIFDQIQGKGQG